MLEFRLYFGPLAVIV